MTSADALVDVEARLDRDCTNCGYERTALIRGKKTNRLSLFCPGCNVATANPYVEYLKQFEVSA